MLNTYSGFLLQVRRCPSLILEDDQSTRDCPASRPNTRSVPEEPLVLVVKRGVHNTACCQGSPSVQIHWAAVTSIRNLILNRNFKSFKLVAEFRHNRPLSCAALQFVAQQWQCYAFRFRLGQPHRRRRPRAQAQAQESPSSPSLLSSPSPFLAPAFMPVFPPFTQ